jgi:integrase
MRRRSSRAIHRDWGEAQGNYDEFRFFTGLPPSEQIALLVSDVDARTGVLRITKARVAGIDQPVTKTGEDRSVVLCPRALLVLKRQLALRDWLRAAGRLNHDYLFVTADGRPLGHVHDPSSRWRKTLRLGRNPLWVAQQHGHSLLTMLRVCAAWTREAAESEVHAIWRAMNPRTRWPKKAMRRRHPARCAHESLGSRLASGHGRFCAKCVSALQKNLAERVGFEPTCRCNPTI